MFDRQQSISRARAVDLSSNDDVMAVNSPTRAVYVGTGGTLVVQLAGNGGAATTYTVAAGSRHPLVVSTFVKAGTTASNIVAEF